MSSSSASAGSAAVASDASAAASSCSTSSSSSGSSEPLHIGIVACSAEGASLCFRTICSEGAAALGRSWAHPEISMHCPSLSLYTDALERKDLAAVGELMLASAEKLARMGASFVCCPDNTIHSALTAELLARCSVPWLRINVVVAAEAARRQYRRVAVLGTRWLVESSVYVDALSAQGITAVRPSDSDRGECHRIIMNELTAGIFKKESTASLQRIIERMKEEETCDAVLLGCTELPLVLSDANSALPTLDSTRLLAHAALQRAVEGCTAPLNI